MRQVRRKLKARNALNFNGGVIAKHVANTIMSECNRQAAREHNKTLKQEGKSICKRILDISKQMTAGKLVLEGGSFVLDEAVYEHGE